MWIISVHKVTSTVVRRGTGIYSHVLWTGQHLSTIRFHLILGCLGCNELQANNCAKILHPAAGKFAKHFVRVCNGLTRIDKYLSWQGNICDTDVLDVGAVAWFRSKLPGIVNINLFGSIPSVHIKLGILAQWAQYSLISVWTRWWKTDGIFVNICRSPF